MSARTFGWCGCTEDKPCPDHEDKGSRFPAPKPAPSDFDIFLSWVVSDCVNGR